MMAGGPEVQLGVAQPSTASDISEIKRPNLKGVRASVFYSTCNIIYRLCIRYLSSIRSYYHLRSLFIVC